MAATNQFGFAKDELKAFTMGDCWALALAIHELTGWELVAIGYGDEQVQPLADRSWVHVGVRHPGGEIIDVTGVHEEGAWLASWHHPAYGATFEITAELLLNFKRCWPHVPQMYAREILAQLSELAPALAAR